MVMVDLPTLTVLRYEQFYWNNLFPTEQDSVVLLVTKAGLHASFLIHSLAKTWGSTVKFGDLFLQILHKARLKAQENRRIKDNGYEKEKGESGKGKRRAREKRRRGKGKRGRGGEGKERETSQNCFSCIELQSSHLSYYRSTLEV